jgi:hypothetical protein
VGIQEPGGVGVDLGRIEVTGIPLQIWKSH